MGAMNAMGHLVTAVAMAEQLGSVDPIWDLLNEMGERSGVGGPTVHAMDPDPDQPRYCCHPDSRQGIEFRANDLKEALLLGATWKAQQMDEHDLWRRG